MELEREVHMEKYGFFDAIVNNGTPDRVYCSDDVNNIFKGMLSDGVFRMYENALNVVVADGLSINIETGKALVKGHWYINTTVLNLIITTAHATLPRISSIVLRYSRLDRVVKIATVDGIPSVAPLAPDLTQNNDIYELRLYDVYIEAGATGLSNTNITDSRTYAKGIVDTPTINYRRYDTVQTKYASGQCYFEIPASYNFTPATILQVYSNGLLCQQTDYTIQVNEVQGTYIIVFNVARELNTQLSFIMIN